LGRKHFLIGITRVRNEALILRDTLDYVGKHVDAIVAYDDAGTDRTLEILSEHAQDPDSAGPVSDRRRAADPASDPTVDLADRADSGLSWRFLSWERGYNGSQFGFVPDKEKCGSQWRNYLSLTYSKSRLLI
jgi:glycosyltransferase involved in cell wall biosynthesis